MDGGSGVCEGCVNGGSGVWRAGGVCERWEWRMEDKRGV